MIVLGIETSCDETAAAIVTSDKKILANEIFSQLEEHKPYGGVVPEIAARAHLSFIENIIEKTMKAAKLEFSDLNGIAATGGPGLIGGLLVGIMTAKSIAFCHNLPFLAVNHLEGHALTVRLTGDTKGNSIPFPFLLLLISGGHCQILTVTDVGKYTRLGTTIDDALGEAFDKSAKMMGLGYPGGPAIEEHAKKGIKDKFKLPRPLKGRPGCDFSFSGLKTKVRQTIEDLPSGRLKKSDIRDLCASFQHAAGDVLIDRSENAIRRFLSENPKGGHFVLSGGVAANIDIRKRLQTVAKKYGMPFASPPVKLCTDNGVMIAWAGIEKLLNKQTDNLSFRPRPKWPLDINL